MTVLLANDTPDFIRGTLKRWFIEPRPNVFVGTLNPRTHRKVLELVLRNAPAEFGLLIVSSAPNSQGYEIERIGPCGCQGRRPEVISGIPLVAEDWDEATEKLLAQTLTLPETGEALEIDSQPF
jgi:CRISPR-associated protein Cas2